MKNCKLRQLCALLLLLLLLSTVALGADGGQRVFDPAGLFTGEEAAQLEQSIAQLRETLQMDVVVVTTTDTAGATTMAFADDFYDYGGFGTAPERSGALLLLDMQHREVYISTTGQMIPLLTDQRISAILDEVASYLAQEDYCGASNAFLAEVEAYAHSGGLTAGWVVGFAALSLLLAALACLGVVARYHLLFKEDNYSLEHNSQLTLSRREDAFLTTTTTQRRIERSSGSGGSSTHQSSSGTSHGGGGRSF